MSERSAGAGAVPLELPPGDPRRVCHSCGAPDMRTFFPVQGIPVHSVLLMHTREAALDYPRGDLLLGFCARCGFIQNTLFDVAHNDYSSEYEETQGFSGVFNSFADQLCHGLIERYGVRGREVLEIGCGKGEFLVRLCELGENRGIGIDPSYRPERTTSEASRRIEFIQDLYSERYAHLGGDCIVCRHTLEHIAPTREFLRTLRRTIGERREVLVFFELPDVLRVLREGAFWDVYYEHCSYFSPGSLARLFRAEGFELHELSLDYDDQYILIYAAPAPAPTRPALPLEEDLEPLAEAVEQFARAGPAAVQRWRDLIRELAAGGAKPVVWGAGSKAVAFLTTLGIGEEIEVLVDINPHKHGKFLPGTGHEVFGPEKLIEVRPEKVLVMNPIYCDEIRAELDRLGLRAELLPV